MNNSVIVLAICLTFMLPFITSAPQNSVQDGTFSPYTYEYKVEDAQQNLYHDKTESSDGNGKVTGRYSVWLPDGRLMIVEYTADENGYVPKISFMDNANPIG